MYRYLVICVGLAACVTAGGEFASPVTGITGTYSDQMVISDHPHHVLFGHVVRVADDAGSVTALVISHRRDGVHRLRIDNAWTDGRRLPFRRMARGLGCSHGHCLNDALGMIPFGPAITAEAARNGFGATLLGPEGGIDIHVPAALFRAAAALQQP